MTTDLIALAKQAGSATYTNRHYPERTVCAFGPEKLQAFADLIRQDEREACAAICDAEAVGRGNEDAYMALLCAKAIIAMATT